jgi:phage anti-repressor protein
VNVPSTGGASRSVEYYATIDMAKEIAALENTEQGAVVYDSRSQTQTLI